MLKKHLIILFNIIIIIIIINNIENHFAASYFLDLMTKNKQHLFEIKNIL